MRLIRMTSALVALIAAGVLGAAPSEAAQCPIKIGSILPVTGPNGSIGKAIAESAKMAVEHVNAAGGVHGCQVEYVLRDTQGQSSVGVDAAKNLVDVQGVPVLIGAVSSGVSMPILTSVAVPAKVTMVSCCSSSPSFTKLAQEGGTQGFWFRTLPTSRAQGYAMAKLANDRNYKKTVVVHVNTDYGVNLAREFAHAFEKLGGKTVELIAYNENQPSYRAEVNKALGTDHDSVVLIAFPTDGTTVGREWFSFGGTQNIVLSNALRADEFVNGVGGKFLSKAVGIDNAQVDGPSVDAFNKAYAEKFGGPPNGPGLHSIYDAISVAMLALAAGSDKATGVDARDNIRKITTPNGEPVYPGVEGFKKALALIKEGKAVRYMGATGPLQFDGNGDVAGPVLVWRVDGDTLVKDHVMTLDDMNVLFKRIDG